MTAILLLAPVALAAVADPCAARGSVPVGRARAAAISGERQAPLGGGPVPRAATGPPLVGGESPSLSDESEEQENQVDPLVANGLGSPGCRTPGTLDAAQRRNCETSGFIAAPDPTANYGIDVHIDTGLLGISTGGLLSIVQDLFVTPVWTALVWVVHAVFVMLEWSFSIDLLEGSAANALQAGLARTLDEITGPWLRLVLAIAAVLVAYRGLVQRRVAEALGETALMSTMFIAGVLLAGDPQGTVGALTRWSDEAALGTLAVAAQGSPGEAGRALGESLTGVFAAVVEGPWCYLEFGEVDWCRDPGRLDPALRAAGLRIAAREQARAGCPGSQLSCGGSASASARLLREAHTNGALFLALPANGPARNSINEGGSLLRTMCGSSDATSCHGPDAAEAEFRTNEGTWPRVVGLVLIAGGLLGMVLLVGHIILRLLGAALLSVFYLLLAPVVVLAPALGEWGRGMFRSWAGHLLAAVVSKLLFAFLLGAVLAMMSLLESLGGLGWWTQWLLMCAFWWGLWSRRSRLFAVAPGARSVPVRSRSRIASRAAETLAIRHVGRTLERRWQVRDGRASTRTLSPPPPPVGTDSGADRQALQLMRFDERHHDAALRAARGRVVAGESQLARIEVARREADATGRARHSAQLAGRAQRVRSQLDVDRRLVASQPRPEGLPRWSAFLDAQSSLPGAAERRRGQGGRDYPALAGLAGLGAQAYRELAPGSQRAARLRIDRELALRRATRDFSALEPRPAAGPGAAPRGEPRTVAGGAESPAQESVVMRDAREVAAGRKRQLGIGKP